MLRTLRLLHVYDSADHDLVHELLVPLLKHSVEYFRGVGFFSSGWLRIASYGIAGLIENGGKAKFVVSPMLEKKDWDAFLLGEEAKHEIWLKQILEKNINDLAIALEQDTRNTLAWMVADELLEFKFAIPRDFSSIGDYHDKVGIFTDQNNDQVAIHGSFNDTIRGSLNGEAFSVFKSWENGQKTYVSTHKDRLYRLFYHGNNQFIVYTIPQTARSSFLRLRSSAARPYHLPLHSKITIPDYRREPQSSIKMYDYQQEAVTSWVANDCHGIFEMATGTGKTITSLSAAINRVEILGKLILIILVPYLHLLVQWQRVCEKFGFITILCSGKHSGWQRDVFSKIQDFNIGVLKSVCIISVHNTATTDKFKKATQQAPSQFTMFIGDEIHALGARNMQKALLFDSTMRLGLSATPHRWFDDIGTRALLEYFGEVCFEFPLEDAIGKYLTPYEYNPIPIQLLEDELAEYGFLSSKISTLLTQRENEDQETLEALKMLLIRRTQIIASAQKKYPALLTMLSERIENAKNIGEDIRGILVYCAPGTHKDVLKSVSSLGLKCHEFVHTLSLNNREKILEQFAKGTIQVLVAIKCLDEGVDIPSTRIAYFLASTTNPREFVQRRGRILRRFEGKTKAEIYDFVVLPEPPSNFNRDLGKSILRREMPRFTEFASSALNEFEARVVVRQLLNQYGMLHLLDERPWDVYHELMKEEPEYKFIGESYV